MRVHVEWCPAPTSTDGCFWVARVGNSNRGFVRQLPSGRYDSVPYGGVRKKDCKSMREAAKRVMAYLIRCSPSIIP